MSFLKPVTPEEAKRAWVSIPNPSARRVAKALTQSGRRAHHSTIARWRAQEWRPVAHSLHPLKAARQRLDMAAGVLTGDPVAALPLILANITRPPANFTTFRGRHLNLEFTVEDYGAFTMPWSATITYQPASGEQPEFVCAQNPDEFLRKSAVPIADNPDF